MKDRSMIRWMILAVVVIALLNLPTSLSRSIKSAFRETARPVELLVDSVFVKSWEYVKSIGRIPRLMEDNDALQKEIIRLNAEHTQIRMLENENEELRRLLKFKPKQSTELIAAEVLTRSRDGWWQTIRLNKGVSDGLGENMAVISMDGLVGKTVAVSKNTADVLLLSDPACRVSARLLRSGSYGMVNGRGPSWQGQVFCRMEFIHKNDELRTGDEVVTSGLGGIFPPDIPIGYVERIYMDASGLYQQADVITRADLSSLRYVFVVRDPNRKNEESRPL